MPTRARATPDRVVECIIPILRVADLRRSLAFYIANLAFKIDWQTDTMAAVSRDGPQLMLCQGEQGNPGTWVWIGVTDIEPLHADLKSRGVRITMPPTEFGWAHEFRIHDPDGHTLRLGSESKRHTRRQASPVPDPPPARRTA